MTAKDPRRGDIWLADLTPVRGHEQAGKRPCLVVSVDIFNRSPAGLVIVLPVTTRSIRIRSHVCIEPPEAGIKEASYIKCEDVRSISIERLTSRWGAVSPITMTAVKDRLRILMGL